MSRAKGVRNRIAVALVAALLHGGVSALPAQEAGSVRGRVVAAETLRPLAGVQVSLVGSRRGTLTNAAGEFLLVGVPAGEPTVRAQMLGYAAQERVVAVAAGAPARADFALAVSAVALDEVVVTGQPEATRRRAVGSSVAVVEAEALVRERPVATLQQLVQGREPGVVAYGASGTVGTAGTLVLRGLTSVTQSNAPTVYVDGVRVDASEKPLFLIGLGGQTTSRLNDLNPADIERVEVVRGAAASALYGSEASGGVVQVFTKRGRAGENSMSASAKVGATRIPDVFPLQHVDPQYPSANDLLSTGAYQQYNLSIRGGGEQLRHYVSGSYLRDEGSFVSNSLERASGLLNLSVTPHPALTADFSSNLAWSRARLPFNDNNALGVLINVLAGNPTRGTAADPYGGLFMPATYVMSIANVDETYRVTSGFTLTHRPFASFQHRGTLGVELVAGEGSTQYPYAPNPLRPKGARLVADRKNLAANFDYAASWTAAVRPGVESVLSAGAQLRSQSDHRLYSSGSAFPSPFLTLLGATTTARELDEERLEYATGGVFVQEQLGFGGRLFLVGGVRVDGSSAFGEDFGTQAYPKLNASYVVSEEEWFRLPAVSTLRLRAGYGKAGTQPGAFDAQRTYLPFTGAGGLPAVHVGEIGNPELAPEVSTEWEAGFDAGLFDERVSLTLTGYQQTTRDALLRRPVAPSLGYLSAQLSNIGTIRNRGVEAGVEAQVVRTGDLSLDLSASYAYNQNEVVDLGGVKPIVLDRFGTRVQEGYPLGGKWQNVVEGVDAAGMPIRSRDAVYVGTGIAPANGSLGGRLGWRGVELFADAQWAAGHVVTNNTRAYMLQRRTGEEYYAAVERNGDNPANPQSAEVRALLARANVLGAFTEEADWLKLREVGATYTLPAGLSRRLGAERATLSLSARNLATLTGYSGPDPEVSATVGYANTALPVVGQDLFTTASVGNDFFTVPQARQLVVGLDVQF